ncbi:MAG: hypothetical protein L0H39_02500, partial [Brachybacterium sp.]|nr:hypothetical protein [Brachybacterium sp.]
MTQKRGLGRGLGALIPGAGSTPAPEQELRTRTSSAASPEGESGSTRPVDMFFSGERTTREEENAQRERAGARDLATGMARAAAERRGRAGSTAGRRSTGTVSSPTMSDGTEKTTPADPSAPPTPARPPSKSANGG